MAGVAQSIQAYLGHDEHGCSYWSPLTTAATRSAHGYEHEHARNISKPWSGYPTRTSNDFWPPSPLPTTDGNLPLLGPKFHLESLLSEQIHTMVIFGGLELVAAGVILHKYNKGKEQERELEREQERRARERRHNRKHHHRRDSPSRHTQKDQGFYPPQSYIPRAQSAPPPRYSPSWQPQTTYYPPQPWQPRPNEKTPAWQSQTQPNYQPPVWQAQAPPQSQSQSQHQQQQPQPTRYPSGLHDDAALSELLRRTSLNRTSETAAGRTQPRPTAVPPPDPSYAELSGDAPRTHASPPRTSPHVAFALPGDELHSVSQRDPPPAYQPYIPQ